MIPLLVVSNIMLSNMCCVRLRVGTSVSIPNNLVMEICAVGRNDGKSSNYLGVRCDR